MNRKWIGFAVVACSVIAGGFAGGLSLGQEQEKHKENETPLGRIMEKVQKHNIAITKGTRTIAAFRKSQKEVAKSSQELAKLAKESKKYKEGYLKNAKDEANPQRKWDDIMDAFAKTSEDLASAATKDGAEQKHIKDMFQVVKKTCSDCHTVFRVEQDF